MKLHISGKPIPAPRPRVSRGGHAYYATSYATWKTEAKRQLIEQLPPGHVPYDFPMTVRIDALGDMPKKTVLLAPQGDCDNHAKSALDALTSAGVWKDDRLVHTLTIEKRWAASHEQQGFHIHITRN